MVVNVSDVMSIYSKVSSMADASAKNPSASGSTETFGQMVSGYLSDGVGKLRESEQAAASAAAGKIDTATLAIAMNNADIALTEIAAIRDKVISAYKEITSGAI